MNCTCHEIYCSSSDECFADEANKAIEGELTCLLQTREIDFVLAENVPRHENVIGTRRILAIKNPGSRDQRYKARMEIQGCLDSKADEILLDSASVSFFASRIILAVSVFCNWPIWTVDAEQAYLHGDDISRRLFARLSRELFFRLLG